MALAYATSNRGGCHLRAYTVVSEMMSNPQYVDPNASEGKARLVKVMQDAYAIYDSLVACKFHSFAIFTTLEYELGDIGTLLSAITGWRYDDGLLREIGGRICAIERVFNIRAGIGPISTFSQMCSGGPEGTSEGILRRKGLEEWGTEALILS